MTGENITVDVATSEEDFNNTTVLEIKEKILAQLPYLSGNDHYVLFISVFLFLC